MKKLLIIPAILFFLLNSICFSQSGWVRVTDSIPNLVIMSMQFTSPLKGYACGSYSTSNPGAFLRTTNGGNNWVVTQFPEYSADDLSFLDDNTGYISSWQGPGKSYVLKTTNGGVNWIKLDSNASSFFKIHFYDYNKGIIASKYDVSHRTTNGGYNWVTMYGTALWQEPNSLISLSADTWLLADKGSSINKTTNGGVNWQNIPFYQIGMNCVTMYFINSTTGFSADYNTKIFKTTNAGNNWFKIDSIGYTYNFNEASLTFPDYLIGYLATGNYVFRTLDGGFNWTKLNLKTNFSAYSIYFINVNTGFVGGSHGFIYKTTAGSTIGINQISENIPDKLSLFQNYPNPFNPSTNIRYQIANNKFVKITVYDLLGKEIETLVNEKQSPGTYEVTFEGSNYPSGVYFYKLSSGDFSETKKMILIK